MAQGSVFSASMQARRNAPLAAVAAFAGMLSVASAQNQTPRLFAPQTFSAPGGVSSLTLSPDGNAAFFDRMAAGTVIIMIAHRIAGGWSTPEVAPLSGRWQDHDPTLAPDGSYLIFTSNRPAVAGGDPLRGGQLWRVDRSSGWASAVRLPGIVNFGTHLYAPSVAANGDVYFQSSDNPEHRFQIYRAPRHDGHFHKPVRLLIAPQGNDEQDPAVAPDGSYIVFDSGPGGSQPERLYIAFREEGRWSKPADFGEAVDRIQPCCSELGPDGHSLYVTSNAATSASYPHTYHIWYLDIEPWLRSRGRAIGNRH